MIFSKSQKNAQINLQGTILCNFEIGSDASNKILRKISNKDVSKLFNYAIASKFNKIANTFIYQNDLNTAKIFAEKSINFHILFDSLSPAYGNSLDTFAEILFKKGDTKKALLIQSKAMPLMNYRNVSKNQKYVEYLMFEKQFKEVKKVAETFIAENLSNKIIDSCYVIACLNIDKRSIENDFKKLRESAKIEFENELKGQLVNTEAPDFTLRDLSGKEYRLSGLKGRIVVLDFWATWCAPCIKSFPAMKKVMSEFEKANVLFLFIDTLENETNNSKQENDINAKILKVLKTKDVSDFIVLKDEVIENLSNTARNYKISAIPAKFIIDKLGHIRYTSVGYSSDEYLIKEISSVIRILNLED